MTIEKWLAQNTHSLKGKMVAITGSTGGLGQEICKILAFLGADLLLLDRNEKKSQALAQELQNNFADIKVMRIPLDLAEMPSVRTATEQLKKLKIDVFIHNAGAYSIPRYVCDTGFDNVFQINFVSPYYIINELLPQLRAINGRVIAVGSIAHNYSKINENDIDFKLKKQSSLVYGNAKRFLMFSLYQLFKNETDVSLTITHPGITFTNITAHYPKMIFAVIKHPMKIIFMKPKKACLSIIKGVFQSCIYREWIGPRWFDIWGLPKSKILKTCCTNEAKKIGEIAENIYQELKNEPRAIDLKS